MIGLRRVSRNLPFVFLVLGVSVSGQADRPWPRHTIDDSSRGADGVRLADVNGDGRLDVVTGWEEGGIVRVCFQPTSDDIKKPWPAVTVGRAPSPEDAFAADLDNDGKLDVVSCHEGKQRCIWIHFQGETTGDWHSTALPDSKHATAWMYGFAMQVDGKHGPDLIVGSKGTKDGMVAWLEAPADPRDAAGWKLHKIQSATWIMSLEPADMDGDGDLDIVVTDRKGPSRGLYWLENGVVDPWKRHEIGLTGHEVMFAQLLSEDDQAAESNPPSVWVATRENHLACFQRVAGKWKQQWFANPFLATSGKAIAVAKIPADGQSDATILLAHTSNSAFSGVRHQQPAVAVTSLRETDQGWQARPWVDVSGLEGTKFDRAEWIDLDGDGDLDLITCEEADNLGVFWYEQP